MEVASVRMRVKRFILEGMVGLESCVWFCSVWREREIESCWF